MICGVQGYVVCAMCCDLCFGVLSGLWYVVCSMWSAVCAVVGVVVCALVCTAPRLYPCAAGAGTHVLLRATMGCTPKHTMSAIQQHLLEIKTQCVLLPSQHSTVTSMCAAGAGTHLLRLWD